MTAGKTMADGRTETGKKMLENTLDGLHNMVEEFEVLPRPQLRSMPIETLQAQLRAYCDKARKDGPTCINTTCIDMRDYGVWR